MSVSGCERRDLCCRKREPFGNRRVCRTGTVWETRGPNRLWYSEEVAERLPAIIVSCFPNWRVVLRGIFRLRYWKNANLISTSIFSSMIDFENRGLFPADVYERRGALHDARMVFRSMHVDHSSFPILLFVPSSRRYRVCNNNGNQRPPPLGAHAADDRIK